MGGIKVSFHNDYKGILWKFFSSHLGKREIKFFGQTDFVSTSTEWGKLGVNKVVLMVA